MGNQPAKRNQYNMFITGIGDPPDGEPSDVPTYLPVGGPALSESLQSKLDADNEKRLRGVHSNLRQGKNMVWTMQVLRAPDQLRQRVAWALAQIFVVSDASQKGNENEAWHAYYDIFVRHAFGRFGDVLREVAYSPMM